MAILKGRLLFIAAALVVLAVVVACGRAGDEARNVLGPDANMTIEPVADQIAATVQVGEADASAEQTAHPAPASQQVDFGGLLATLGDYELVVDTSFEGQDSDGLPISFHWRGKRTFTANPPSYRLDLETSGDNRQDAIHSMTILQRDEQSQLYLPSVGCIALFREGIADDLDLPLDPADLLRGWSLVGPAPEEDLVVDGPVTEYHVDESTLERFSAGPWSVEGVAHVTQSANLMIDVALTVSGQGDLLGEGRELNGIYQIVIDVKELDEGLDVEVPEACQQALPYPVTEDAFDLSTIDDLLAFRSHMPLGEVVDFYLAQMPVEGWQLAGEPEVFNDLAFFNYERDGRQIMITIETNPENGTVSVLLSP